MKFVNDFKAGYVSSYGPAGTPHKAIYVDSRDVCDLLVALKQEEIEIDKSKSVAVYGDVEVPFGTLFPDNRRANGYILREINLEINLSNWHSSDAKHTLGGPIIIGGSSTRETAVECKLERVVGREEDGHEVLDEFISTCDTVADFYSQLSAEQSVALQSVLRGRKANG